MAHSEGVSMYVEVLSGAINGWDTDLSGDELVDYVFECRAALPARDLGAGVWSEQALIDEVMYDRALICLAAERGIEVTPTNFVHPKIERERLEVALAGRGLDLRSPHRRSSDHLGAAES
jgi:hypothetical protein